MNNLPTPPPLLDIIERLKSCKIDNQISQIQKRMDNASNVVTVLCDLSASMMDYVGNSHKSKLDMMKESLTDVVKYHPGIRIIGFSDRAFHIIPSDIYGLHTMGSTNMAAAFQLVKPWNPQKTIIISDGYPDNPQEALREAETMTGTIDIIYCGAETDLMALGFMSSLCKISGGKVVKWNLQMRPGLENNCNILRQLMPPGV